MVTKRAYAYEDATVEWIDGNIGGRLAMKYPSVYMLGRNAHAEIVSFAFAGSGQHQDLGAKAVHLGENTTSKITSKSISKSSGRTTHRGLMYVGKGAIGAKADLRFDALTLDENSRTDMYPYFKVNEKDAMVSYEGTVGGVGVDQIFYLMSRGYTDRKRSYSIWIVICNRKLLSYKICELCSAQAFLIFSKIGDNVECRVGLRSSWSIDIMRSEQPD